MEEEGSMVHRLIGVDIGGTKTHGVRFDDGLITQEAVTGSANVQNVDISTASVNLEGLLRSLHAPEVSEVCVGAGGIDTPDDVRALTSLIHRFVPRATVTVVHDSRLLLAAARASTGISVISGTGSAVWGINDQGDEIRYGGWGYLLGDEGSGYWLGREAVRNGLHIANEGNPPDALTRAVLAHCGASSAQELIMRCHSADSPRHYLASIARTVIKSANQGDDLSDTLLTRAGQHLGKLAASASKRLGIAGPVVLGGGVGTNAAQVQRAFQESLSVHDITDVEVLGVPPAYGAQELSHHRAPSRDTRQSG